MYALGFGAQKGWECLADQQRSYGSPLGSNMADCTATEQEQSDTGGEPPSMPGFATPLFCVHHRQSKLESVVRPRSEELLPNKQISQMEATSASEALRRRVIWQTASQERELEMFQISSEHALQLPTEKRQPSGYTPSASRFPPPIPIWSAMCLPGVTIWSDDMDFHRRSFPSLYLRKLCGAKEQKHQVMHIPNLAFAWCRTSML
ncbi:hypothetical protein Q7P37_002416 [Cladosporium fusiforme]